MPAQLFDKSRFETLVHYVCWSCDDRSKLGKTKLNKVLWFSDVCAFMRHGRGIAGETYRKDKHGPVSVHVGEAVGSLEESGALRVDPSNYYDFATLDFVATREPDMSAFSDEEAAIVAEAIRFVCYENSATSISEMTHDRSWEIAQRGEEMPLYAVLASEMGEVTQADIDWANEVE